MASSNPNSNSNTNAANQSSLLRPPPPSFPSSALFSAAAAAAAQHQPPPPHPLRSPFQLPPTSINPSPAAPKRPPPHKPPPPSSSAAAASAAAAAKSAELTPAARRKKRKLPDKHLPDRVAALLPESALYTQLLEFESRVDAALARKRLDIQDSLKSPPSLHRTLRLFVFNTADASSSSWTLRLLGRLLDDLGDPVPNPPKLSSFFKRLTVSLDPALYPDNPTVVWDQARSPAPHDGFEIKRRGGDRDFTAAIRLEINYSPERFKLSPALADLLGIEVDTRARVLAGVWHYVKARKLQHPADPASFVCDPPLRKVFGEDRVRFALVSQKISQHLSPPQPIQIEHRVRVSGGGTGGNAPLGTACYDVQVDVPFPLQKEMAAFLANTEKQKEIDACDEVICASIKKIHEHRRRRAFFLGFSQSPVEFINALIASQSRDLKLVAGEASRNAEKERRSDFYNQPWVEDAVIRYLNRKPAAGSEAPGST